MSQTSSAIAAPQALIDGVLGGSRLAIARAITRVENESVDAQPLLRALYPHTGHGHIIGVTGAPGTGKSTLVTALVQHFRRAGLTVAVVAVDPTSPFTGGALLGDRVRMQALSGDNGVFVRSMATRGSLGGLSKTTSDVIAILDAAGFERIIVETVGVGQAEVEIAHLAHTTLVVEAPGLGDGVQAIKAGVLEIADVLVVNKADLPGVDRTVQALESMLEMRNPVTRPLRHHGQLLEVVAPAPPAANTAPWPVIVMRTVAQDNTGVDALGQQIEAHRAWLHSSGEIHQRERRRIANTLENILRAELNRRILARLPADALAALVEEVRQRTIDPYAAGEKLLAEL